jgi:hypothetical protein
MGYDLALRVLHRSSLFLDTNEPFASTLLFEVHWLAALAALCYSDCPTLLSGPNNYSPSRHNGNDSIALVITTGSRHQRVVVVTGFASAGRYILLRDSSMDAHIQYR